MAPVQSRVQGARPNGALRRAADIRACKTVHPGRKYKLDDGTSVELETLYLVPNHVQRHGIKGRTWIYYQDTSPEGLAKTWGQEKRLKTPKGNLSQILSMGYLQLSDRDSVFSREYDGEQEPIDDVCQIWVADGRLWTLEMKLQLDLARKDILGDRGERTRARPSPPIGKDRKPTGAPPLGGTAYERSSIAKSVKEPARAYTIGPSLEAPTSLMAPVASSKAKRGAVDPAIWHRKLLLEATSRFAMGAMTQGPNTPKRMIRRRSELLNKPSIGISNNWAYSTAQLNLAAAKKASDADISLGKDLGFFGGTHIDRHDAAGYYSNMTCNHDIPDDYEPGMFFILQLGVFVVLNQYCSINFFGQRQHGGTPPLCPLGRPLYKYAYRFVVISYPPRRQVNGTARVILAALPNNEALILPPEILHTWWVLLY
ncbi:hypothetical protein B0H10DRAFT_1948013 [Mycena sp. CBHHK59/15]|nr:hypothetical protein B0H10DRAFT_1970545 [Mycena sp. CBHHK59/15]KAJ6617828.1 hypothetical protein B0H10DRAFT_1948013 [Mycena sp. CBHHK59/15]